MNTPFLTARRVAMVETVGIASPRACGQAITNTVIAIVAAKTNGCPMMTDHTRSAVIETKRAVNVSHLEALSANFWTDGLVCLACAIRLRIWPMVEDSPTRISLTSTDPSTL